MTPWAIPRATRGGEGLLLSESGLSSWTGVWHGRGSSLCTPRWGLSARPRLCWVPRAAVTWSASEEGASATFLYRTFSEFLDCKEEEVSTLRARLPGVVAVPFLFSKAAKQPCISCCKQTTRDLMCFGHESALWAKLEWNSSFCSPWYRPRWHPPQARPARWGYALGSLGMPLLRRSQWFPRLPYVMAWLVWLLDAGAGPACAPRAAAQSGAPVLSCQTLGQTPDPVTSSGPPETGLAVV